jgi:hypothetical protein
LGFVFAMLYGGNGQTLFVGSTEGNSRSRALNFSAFRAYPTGSRDVTFSPYQSNAPNCSHPNKVKIVVDYFCESCDKTRYSKKNTYEN